MELYEDGWRNVTANLARRVLDTLLPCPCLSCRASVEEPRRSLGLCAACRRRLRPWPERACAGCAQLVEHVDGLFGGRCPACDEDALGPDRLLSGWCYEAPLDASIGGLKFRRLAYLGAQLGRALAVELGDRLPAADLIVPVPLHWTRCWQRGYDQAVLIATGFADERRLPVVRGLRRCRSTPPQSRLGRSGRLVNPFGAFAARRRRLLSGRNVLLIDDVTTTGATLAAAAECLRGAGVGEVIGVTVARASAARTPEGQTPSVEVRARGVVRK